VGQEAPSSLRLCTRRAAYSPALTTPATTISRAALLVHEAQALGRKEGPRRDEAGRLEAAVIQAQRGEHAQQTPGQRLVHAFAAPLAQHELQEALRQPPQHLRDHTRTGVRHRVVSASEQGQPTTSAGLRAQLNHKLCAVCCALTGTMHGDLALDMVPPKGPEMANSQRWPSRGLTRPHQPPSQCASPSNLGAVEEVVAEKLIREFNERHKAGGGGDNRAV